MICLVWVVRCVEVVVVLVDPEKQVTQMARVAPLDEMWTVSSRCNSLGQANDNNSKAADFGSSAQKCCTLYLSTLTARGCMTDVGKKAFTASGTLRHGQVTVMDCPVRVRVNHKTIQ